MQASKTFEPPTLSKAQVRRALWVTFLTMAFIFFFVSVFNFKTLTERRSEYSSYAGAKQVQAHSIEQIRFTFQPNGYLRMDDTVYQNPAGLILDVQMEFPHFSTQVQSGIFHYMQDVRRRVEDFNRAVEALRQSRTLDFTYSHRQSYQEQQAEAARQFEIAALGLKIATDRGEHGISDALLRAGVPASVRSEVVQALTDRIWRDMDVTRTVADSSVEAAETLKAIANLVSTQAWRWEQSGGFPVFHSDDAEAEFDYLIAQLGRQLSTANNVQSPYIRID